MQPCQPQTSDRRIPSSAPAESADVFAARQKATSKPSKYTTTVGQALKERTGFSTYAAFLEKNNYGCLRSPNEPSGLNIQNQNGESHCAIINLSREPPPTAKVSLQGVKLSALQTLSALSEPPKDVSVQIVVLSVPHKDSLGLATEFSSLFGLGLDLAPRFFLALTAQLERHADFEISSNSRFRCRYLLASGTVVAIARRFAFAGPESPFIVLIAGPPKIHGLIGQNALCEMLNDGLKIHEPVHENWTFEDDDSDNGGAIYYARLLSHFMGQNRDFTHDFDHLLLASLLPLLQLDILRLREFCSVVRGYFVGLKSPIYKNNGHEILDNFAPDPGDDKTPEKLYRYRTILRSAIEQVEDEAEPLTAFVSSQIGEHSTTSPAFTRFEGDRLWVLKEAGRLEAEIRDYLQVQAGHLALLESRKSIELSNYQIQEGKRGELLALDG